MTALDHTSPTRSSVRCSFGLFACACAAIRAIRAGVESSMLACTRRTKEPSRFTEPAGTSEPVAARTGALSPLMCCRDTLAVPHTTMPSNGTFSPEFTSTCWPTPTVPARHCCWVWNRGCASASSTSTTWALSGTLANRRARLPRARDVKCSSKVCDSWNSSSSNAPSWGMPMYSVPSAASAMSTCVFSVPLAAMHSDSKICGAPDSTQGMHRAVLASRGAVPWGSSAESAGSSAKEATKKPSTAAHRHALLWVILSAAATRPSLSKKPVRKESGKWEWFPCWCS
mmetsp:Transcript_1695/g.4242  ORF Transcript_1695/g.4242 Transcript_1695/m.4242 type:complete len:285 (-) Transcript_1695:414-1268(-)